MNSASCTRSSLAVAVAILAIFLVACGSTPTPQSSAQATAQKNGAFTSEELNQRTIRRRAVDAVIWGLPLISEYAVKQAYFRDGKANYNDIVWWPKGGGWKNQSPTPNVNTRYMYFFINTKKDGPVVVDLPAAVSGASFYGTIEDAWYGDYLVNLLFRDNPPCKLKPLLPPEKQDPAGPTLRVKLRQEVVDARD
jgi:hypothetical protein